MTVDEARRKMGLAEEALDGLKREAIGLSERLEGLRKAQGSAVGAYVTAKPGATLEKIAALKQEIDPLSSRLENFVGQILEARANLTKASVDLKKAEADDHQRFTSLVRNVVCPIGRPIK